MTSNTPTTNENVESGISISGFWGVFDIETTWKNGQWTFKVEIMQHYSCVPATLEDVVRTYRKTLLRDKNIKTESDLKQHLISKYTSAVLAHRYLVGEITEEQFRNLTHSKNQDILSEKTLT